MMLMKMIVMCEQRFTIQKARGMYLHLPIFDNGVEMADGDVCILLNEQQATIITLKRRLEKINGGYGLLTHRNGLTANECLIESQERELEKKNEQISDWIERHSKDIEKISEQQNTISQLEEENEQLKEELNNLKKDETMLYHYYTLARYGGD